MKNLKWILVFICCISLVSAKDSMSQTSEIVIHTSAQCSDCKKAIEKELMAQKGVKFAELNIDTKNVKVVYNSKKTNPETIKKVISLIGYDADEIPADPKAVERLKPCCTKDGHVDH